MATAEKKTTKHTPGPWVVNDGTIEAPHSLTDVTRDSKVIGSVLLGLSRETFRVGSRAEQRANARLIAAAPDLLAACRIALEAIRDVHHGISTADRESMIEQAIAKAEGKD